MPNNSKVKCAAYNKLAMAVSDKFGGHEATKMQCNWLQKWARVLTQWYKPFWIFIVILHFSCTCFFKKLFLRCLMERLRCPIVSAYKERSEVHCVIWPPQTSTNICKKLLTSSELLILMHRICVENSHRATAKPSVWSPTASIFRCFEQLWITHPALCMTRIRPASLLPRLKWNYY